MKKYFFLIIVLQICSCAPIRFKEIEYEYIPKYETRVSEVVTTHVVYEQSSDTISFITKSTEKFDVANKCILLIEDYGSRQCYAKHFYENRLLKTVDYKFSDSTSATLNFQYDALGRQINSIFCENGSCSNFKTFYDDKDNIIKKLHFDKGLFESSSLYDIDYKRKTRTVYSLKDSLHDTYYIFKHDKRGNIIRTEGHSRKNGRLSFVTHKYDKYDNRIKRIGYNSDTSMKDESTYNYYRDKKGNVIKLEHFLNGKLFELTTYDITYR